MPGLTNHETLCFSIGIGSHGTAPTSNTIPSSPEIGGSRWPQDISLDFSSFSIFSASPQILYFSGAAFSEQYFSRVPLSSLRFLCGSSRHCPFHLLLPSSYSYCMQSGFPSTCSPPPFPSASTQLFSCHFPWFSPVFPLFFF